MFMRQFRQLPAKTRIILIIQSIGMLMGTSTHLMWTLHNGFLSPNYNAPLGNVLFWDSLTFLDPLAAILIFLKPKWGIILTFLIITVDVIHNNWYYFDELYLQNRFDFVEWLSIYWMIPGQIIFGIFVWATFRSNLAKTN